MSKPDIWMPVYIGHYLASAMHLAWKKDGAVLLAFFTKGDGVCDLPILASRRGARAGLANSSRALARNGPKAGRSGLFPECSREFICIAGRVWREYGKARTKAQAFDIRGFPLGGK